MGRIVIAGVFVASVRQNISRVRVPGNTSDLLDRAIACDRASVACDTRGNSRTTVTLAHCGEDGARTPLPRAPRHIP